MNSMQVTVVIFAGAAVFAVVKADTVESPVAGPFLAAPIHVTTSEHHLRARAERLVRPQCPSRSVAVGQTVVGVISVVVASGGAVLDAVAAEPEAGDLADALRQAGLSSRFKPSVTAGNPPEILTAKLTHYFRNTGEHCEVIDPFALDPNQLLLDRR